MKRKSVVSSNIASVGYENEVVEIEFVNGGIWQYHEVPREVYNELMAATSIGSYFSLKIRPKYKATKVL